MGRPLKRLGSVSKAERTTVHMSYVAYCGRAPVSQRRATSLPSLSRTYALLSD